MLKYKFCTKSFANNGLLIMFNLHVTTQQSASIYD